MPASEMLLGLDFGTGTPVPDAVISGTPFSDAR